MNRAIPIMVSLAFHALVAGLLYEFRQDVGTADERAPIEFEVREPEEPAAPPPLHVVPPTAAAKPVEPAPEPPQKKPAPPPKPATPRPALAPNRAQTPSPGTPTAVPQFGLRLESTTTAAPGEGLTAPEGNTTSLDANAPPSAKEKPGKPAPSASPSPREPEITAATANSVTTLPTVAEKVTPEYPQEVRKLGIEGRVKLLLVVGEDGQVEDVRVLQGLDPRLDGEAVKAARRMRFNPALRDGAPVQVQIPYSFVFVLG